MLVPKCTVFLFLFTICSLGFCRPILRDSGISGSYHHHGASDFKEPPKIDPLFSSSDPGALDESLMPLERWFRPRMGKGHTVWNVVPEAYRSLGY
ncbi:hypothetical protein BKA70DRAFT_1307641 [Coprinopsis sp. MPI-PUGE-AT-0042]|nr:hypothetical protein BKA70DRAFT_1307641 [Coprinopsis sp. MPI-PUGE-AT-0042]